MTNKVAWNTAPDAIRGGYHCRACARSFGSLQLFDTHQVWSNEYSKLRCRDESSTALNIEEYNGVWYTPEGAAKVRRTTAYLTRYRVEKSDDEGRGASGDL